MAGPPAVGKTSFKHLLFNWDPPHHHHSTAIADRPIRAVERVATLDGAKSWEMINTKDLMEMLAEDIRIQATLNTTVIPTFESKKTKNQETLSIVADDMGVTQHFSSQATQSEVHGESKRQQTPLSITESSVSPDIHRTYTQTISSEANEDGMVKDEVTTENQQQLSATKNDDESSNVGSDIAIHTTFKKKNILELSKDIFSSMRGTKSRQL